MKNFFAVIGCLLGFAVLVTLCYFFVNPKDPRSFTGKFTLYKIITTDISDEDNPIETEEEIEIDETKYIKLESDWIFNRVGITELSFEENVNYTFVIIGTKIEIKKMGKTIYSGAYAENEIVLTRLDDENKLTYEYYYKKID